MAAQGTRASNTVSAPTSIIASKSGKQASGKAAAMNNDEFIGLDNQAEEQKNGAGDAADFGEDEIGLIDKLKEDSKRLNITRLGKF